MREVLAIIGGGASGLIAAITAALNKPSGSKCQIILLEKQERVGRKILSTGNGRCNITHIPALPENYHGQNPSFAQAVFSRFNAGDNIRFFASLGLLTEAEENGNVYPSCRQAAAVLDVLRLSAQEKGVAIYTGREVSSLSKDGDNFILHGNSGQLPVGKVIVACGGRAAPSLGGSEGGYRLLMDMGHSLVPTFPAIAPLYVTESWIKALKGLRVQGLISLYHDDKLVRKEYGEVQFTDYGLSGIAAMQLAREAGQILRNKYHSDVLATLNFLPNYDSKEVFLLLCERRSGLGRRPLEDFLTGIIAKRLGQILLKQAGIGPQSRLSQTLTDKELIAITAILNNLTFTVYKVGGFVSAQATSGGICTNEFDPLTMESLLAPGLFATGEVLDVDGDCGGYNLQWAWSSGRLAGASAIF